MKKRNRNSIALTTDGILVIRDAVSKKGWNQGVWANMAATSVSTIKRLLAGKAIDTSCFKSLIQVLRLEVQENHIVRRISHEQPTSLTITTPVNALSALESTSTISHLGFLMTGRFAEDKRPQIERALRHLQSLLLHAEIIFGEDEGSVVVTGHFSEDNEAHIKMTISYLEKLLKSCKVTW